jgi:sugar phosphate isomerase/epimerase
MEIGVCGGPELASTAQMAGLDYFEWSVGAFLQPRNDPQFFHQSLQSVYDSPLSCPAVNVFIPADLKITGPKIDEVALENFVITALERAQRAEIDVIVFGSGGARRVPDGFDRQVAYQQLLQFGRMVAQQAQRYAVQIAVEPLNRNECNILNTLSECAQYVREIDHPNLRLLVDAYHWLLEKESPQSILAAGNLLIHAHIATPANRLPPGAEEFDFTPFFEALTNSGYTGRLSIEARLSETDLESELHRSAQLIRRFI